MSLVHTETVRTAHPYTSSKAPWILSEYHSAYGKLIHYLSGGGMSAFGRTIRQEEVRIKHRRFLITAAIIATLWLLVYFC